MKKLNKKGFTIVELVIVIAVIAILAAVLIPTFSGVIAKANLSNDKSFVKNMNTTLLAEGTVDKFENAGDAIDALNRNGFSGKYETYSSGYHYVYSLEKNQMYLLDDENKVVYPEGDVALSSLWGMYTDNRTSFVSGITKYVAMTNITNSEHYNDVFASGNYTLDLNGYYISVSSTVTGVTANNGIVLGGANAGDGVNTDYEVIQPALGKDTINEAELGVAGLDGGSTVVIENKIFTSRVLTQDSDLSYVFKNCIFYGQGIQFFDGSGAADGVTATIENCQFIDIAEEQWALIASCSLTVKDSTFTKLNKRGAIQIHEDSKDMAINITGCTFDGTGGDYPLIRFVDEYLGAGESAKSCNIASLAITDCKFTTLNKAKGIIGFSGSDNTMYNYTGTGVELTFSGNSLDSSITADKYVAGAPVANTLADKFAAGVK